MAGLQVLPCILVCAAAALVANGTLTELDLALLPQRPGLTTQGTEFIFAFMGNDKVESPLHKAAIIVITTEESRPVEVTVEVNPAFYVNNPNLNTATFPQTRMQTVEPGSSITFEFPVAQLISESSPPDQDIRVYNINDRLDRNSGIRISTDGGKISVYGLNKEMSSMDAFNIFPCYEYPAIVGDYEYVVLSAEHRNRDSSLMIVGCQDNTKVMITPPSQLPTISAAVPDSLGGSQTPRPNVPLNISDLDQLTSILLNNRDDVSGTKITSDKPIAVFTGHECGNIPKHFASTCDHLIQQVPPQVTWGRLFFTVPIVGRYSGDHYRVATATAKTQFTVTCRTLTNPTPTTETFTINFNSITKSGFEVFNTNIGTTSGDRASRKEDLQWCCIESNNPVLVMQYAYGHYADTLLKDSGTDTFGDPLMTIVPPVVQYLNNYTAPTEMGLRESQLDVGFTVAIPRDETFFRSPTEDGSRILLNDEAIMPDPDEGWIEIFCANGQICGYSARVEHAPDGMITIRHVDPRAAVSAWIYGIAGAVSFGFTAGFKLDAVTFPIMRAENVTVVEMDGVAVITFTRTGSLSLGSRFNARLMSGSATSPVDYDADYVTSPTDAIRTVINATTNELVMRSNIASVTATFDITKDTILEDSEDFVLFLEGTRRVFILTPVVSVTILDSPPASKLPCLGVLSNISCDFKADGTCYTASYAVQRDNSVTFFVSAKTPPNTWVGFGVSDDQQMVNTDIVLGAADGTKSFIHDRFAFEQAEPPVDPSQDISRASAEHVDGVTTITFNRPRNSSDINDISLDKCRFFLFAYGGRVNFFARPPVAIYHGFGPTHRGASAERICIPTFTECSGELHVSINVSYIPPRGTELESNEYRAASGPVTVTCTAMGGTGSVSYQWSSTCRNCPFLTARSSSVHRAAVHSGDTGTHTCTATSGSTTGSASINFSVVGAGIHLFKGASTDNLRVPRSLPNNGIVVSLNATSDFRFHFVCRSDSMVENTGTLIGPNGTIITTGSVFTIAHPLPGDLRVENIPPQNILTASDQGVYTCRIPLQSGETRDIHVGIYPSGFNTLPNITHLGFTHGLTSSTLTCISTGSPSTTVTWVKDGQPLTIDGSLYQLTQTVTDRRLSTYENVLTINAVVFSNTYACSVHNALGSQTRFLTGYIISIEHEAYHVNEGDEYVEVCAILVRGIPTNTATITLTTVDGGAAASKDYTSIAENLVLNSVLTRSCVLIPILNDVVPEFAEDFTVKLTVNDDRAVIATEATVTINDDDVEPEPEKGCTVKVFVLASMREEQQMAVVHILQSVFPGLFGAPLPTDATTDEPTDSTTTTTNGLPIFSTVRKDPLLSMTYTTLAEEFDRVESDAGYTQFVEAVTEITEAYQESCSGTKPSLNDVPKLAQQFAALSPTAVQELRNIFGKMLCIRQLYSTKASRRKRQTPVSPRECPPGGIFDPSISVDEFFACLGNDIPPVFGFTNTSFPCLAFVVDTTGSMRHEIEAVQNLIQSFLSSEKDEPACYAITPFNDVVENANRQPVHGEDYGPVGVYDTKQVGDLQNMLNNVEYLRASGGGGDCVEFGMHAIRESLRAPHPYYGGVALDNFSQIILITDAGAKDGELQDAVIELAHRREVCIHLLLSTRGYCPNSFGSYLNVSRETGGTTVWVDPDEIEQLISLFGQFRTTYQAGTSCEDFYSNFNRKKRNSPEQCESFRVSVFTNILKFLITTQPSQSQATVRSPSGAVTEVSIFSGYGSQTIVHPEIGEWFVCVENGTLSISFNNQVLLDYVVTFIEEDEQSPTRVASTTNVPPGCSSGRVAILTSRVSDISSASLNLISNGNIFGSVTLTPCSGAMVGNATFPLGGVTYQLQGEDMGGNPFIHNSRRTRQFNPGNYLLTPSSTNPQEIRLGESLVLTVQLHNQNVYGVTNFTLSVESPNGFSAFLKQTSVSLQAGSETQLCVPVSANSVLSGSIHRIIVTATDECNVKVSAPLTLTVIALDFEVKAATEISCPGGETTTTNPPACSSGKVSVFTSQPIPGIILTLLNFVKQGSVVASASLTHACGSAMVGNVIFPLGSVAYQLQGENQNGKTFKYESTSTVEFNPGSYSLAVTSTRGELRPGEPVMLTFELHNQNQITPATFTISSAAPSRFNVVPQETHITLAAGSSTQIGARVTAGSHPPGSTHQITLRATDGCATVSASQTLTIAAPPTSATNECGCTIHGTCIVAIRRGRRFLSCWCDSGYGGRLCDEEY